MLKEDALKEKFIRLYESNHCNLSKTCDEIGIDLKMFFKEWKSDKIFFDKVKKITNDLNKVEIKWSKPILLDNRKNSQNFDEEIGIYLISRKYKRNGCCYEKFIYVGETVNFFNKRFNQHINKESSWLNPRGAKYIRFGKIKKKPDGIEDVKHFTKTIESTIIQKIKDKPNVKLVNKKQIKSCTIWNELHIHNEDYKGCIPKDLNTLDIECI